MSPRYTLILAIAVGSLVVSASASKRDAEATTLVEHAKQLSEIRSEGAPAFRLKASLRVFNQNGSTTEGEYIENWASIAQWRKEVAVGDFRRTEVAMGRKRWLLDSNPSAPEQIGTLSSFTELGGLQPATWPSRKLEDRESNGLSVRCVESGVRALCFDKIVGTLISESTLVRTGEAYRKSICVYSDYEKFGERLLAKSYVCSENKKPTIEARILEFTVQPAFEASLFTAPEGARESVNCLDSVQLPRVLYSENPPPPRRAPDGTMVFLSVTVGTDGKPKDLIVVSAPNPDFDRAALNALKNWSFSPAHCGKEPIEKSIEVQMQFNTF
jgi:TonB family protein